MTGDSLTPLSIGGRLVGPGEPVFLVAEMSASHHQDFKQAAELIAVAKEAGVDAVKLQTYTPDTLTLDSRSDIFRVKGSTWNGRYLYDLYNEAYTPWEWHRDLQELALETGLIFFSTPFDALAVELLENMDVPAYKIASFEIVDIPLIRLVASTGKPIILSTGMASQDEIREAVEAARDAGAIELALLKCTSSYPARYEDMNLRSIRQLVREYRVPVGLSDHSLDSAVAVAAVTLGACIIEKHFTLSRKTVGPDSSFSFEPDELAELVQSVRTAELALGDESVGNVSLSESVNRSLRRSLFAVKDIAKGERITPTNVRSIRPANGMHPRYLEMIQGREANEDIRLGTPLSWSMLSGPPPD